MTEEKTVKTPQKTHQKAGAVIYKIILGKMKSFIEIESAKTAKKQNLIAKTYKKVPKE